MSIVGVALQYHDVIVDAVHQAMLRVDSSRLTARWAISKLLRLANSFYWMPNRTIEQAIEAREGRLVIGLPRFGKLCL